MALPPTAKSPSMAPTASPTANPTTNPMPEYYLRGYPNEREYLLDLALQNELQSTLPMGSSSAALSEVLSTADASSVAPSFMPTPPSSLDSLSPDISSTNMTLNGPSSLYSSFVDSTLVGPSDGTLFMAAPEMNIPSSNDYLLSPHQPSNFSTATPPVSNLAIASPLAANTLAMGQNPLASPIISSTLQNPSSLDDSLLNTVWQAPSLQMAFPQQPAQATHSFPWQARPHKDISDRAGTVSAPKRPRHGQGSRPQNGLPTRNVPPHGFQPSSHQLATAPQGYVWQSSAAVQAPRTSAPVVPGPLSPAFSSPAAPPGTALGSFPADFSSIGLVSQMPAQPVDASQASFLLPRSSQGGYQQRRHPQMGSSPYRMPQPGFPSQASAVPGNVQPSRSRGPPPFAAPFSLQLVPVPAGHLQSGPSAASSSPLAMRPAQMASLPVQPAPPKSRRRRHQTGPSEDRDGARAFIEALPKVDNALPLEGTDPQRDPLERPWCEPRLSSKKLQFTEPQRARNPTRGTMKDSRSVPPASSASSTSSASPYPPPATVGAVIVDPDGKLVSHRWLHKVSSGLREDRESLVGAQFTQLLAANPQLLVDRQQRIQATPNHSRTRFHLARSSEHFQSLAILLGPKDYITHSERSGCMNAEWYYMPGRNRALTAWTFDDIYTALYKYLDDHPQSFCKADGDVTVAPDQLLDFRCGSPSPSDNDNDDDATGQWNTLPGMPIRAVSDKDGHKELHIEVQVKRVGGTDLALASRCGVHYSVYGALNNDKGLAMPCQGHRNRVAPGQKSEASVHECVEKPFDRARLKDSGWQYVAKSHVYIVRLVARNATSAPHGGTAAHVVLKTGGWLVPPVEDRLRLYEKKHGLQEAALAPRPGMAGTSVDDVSSLPKPLAPLRAAPSPALNTHTNAQTPLLCGGTAPEVWTQLADPAVEDVLWMASKLITGTTFKGFRKGAGAGLDMSMAVNREYIRLWEEKVPYASPSRSATLHSDLLYLAHLAGHQLDRP